MAGLYIKRMTGQYGRVVIPSIGITIGEMGSWTLTRHEDSPPGVGEWDLHAVFSYINEFAWNAGSWEKQVIVVVGDRHSGIQYRLEPTNERTVLDGRSLLIKGATLWPLKA